MANSLHKLYIDDAVGKKNKFNLSRTHLTTMEIGEIMPIMHEDCVPGDVINVGESIFSRLAPLAVPTYGHFNFKTATMFVPYYQVFEGAEAFFGGKTVSRGQTIKLPYITKGELLNAFLDNDISYNVPYSGTDLPTAQFDFSYKTTEGVKYWKLTSKGRWFYKVVRSLGYQIPNLVSTTTNVSASLNYGDKLNALPLLCFLKAYNDFMSQSQRYDTSQLTSALENIRLGIAVSNTYTAGTGAMSGAGLVDLFNLVYLQYGDDYFTTCWKAPTNAIGNVTGEVNYVLYNDVSGSSSPIQNSGDNVYASFGNQVTQRGLDFLRSFDNWVRRNNYAGSREVEKIYARFGIHPEDYKAQYAHLVNTSSTSVQVGDVTSLTDSLSTNGGAVLGAYAGKGIVNGDSGYKYTCTDFGYLITLCWITVKPMYSNGYDRTVLKMDSLDFFNPEFDGLGGNPVSQAEVFSDRKNRDGSTNKDKQIFGFNERYNEYKSGNRDQITGDFVVYEDMDTWHFDREDLKTLQKSGKMVAQDGAFTCLNNTIESQNQYNRIFNVEAEDSENVADHFYITANFDVEMYRPMKNLNQVPNLGEGDTVIERNGNVIH